MKTQVRDLGLRHSRERVTGDVYRLRATRAGDLGLRDADPGRRLPARIFDQGGELFSRGSAHAGQQVLVGVHRERGVGVPEAFADDFHRDAGHESRDACVCLRS